MAIFDIDPLAINAHPALKLGGGGGGTPSSEINTIWFLIKHLMPTMGVTI